ncbi:hypothetical protein NEMBOFW57_002593 [Staphylotrichum longicolle]|uniref:Uncharacterized protein n=1 Tax=Staphylotrichum longicolle TaxID=669026 RepID=A0AAD4F374_9PEZI|nr:hypothetical protein NEMBOFW57_002593 [Staphylotrichum longicolle]
MASRIASYYQQRCQARQKCQEMMQAATVIVAWYIRDRIARRRRRQKRAFKRGWPRGRPSRRRPRPVVPGEGAGSGAGRVTKGEAVRRGPITLGREMPRDRDEVDFDMDREVPADKDTQLFHVADNLIKSHLARIDVPLLGESESESDFMDYEDYEEEEEEEEEEDYEEDEGGEANGEQKGYGDGEARGRAKEDTLGSTSKEAQLGTTTKGSRKRSSSCIS